jgi:hypothetical protein
MSRRWLLSLLCLAVLFLSLVQLTRARGELSVDEDASSISFEKDPAQVLLAVVNRSSATVNTNVQLEILDQNNKAITRITAVHPIARGNHQLKLSLPFAFAGSGETALKRILWYRLHYRLSPQDSPAETLAGGIISLSEMTTDFFELRVSTGEILREGNRYRVRVQAIHPTTERPAPNVRINAQLTLEGDGDKMVKLNASKLTDAKGLASLDLALPPRFPQFPHDTRPSGGELEVTGRKGPFVVETKGELLVDQFARILITTDKPLYQPGQVMHMRALVLSPAKHALANTNTYFKVSDPEGALLYRTVVTTSRFGVASADWTIPENTRLGDYRISVGVDGGEENQSTRDVRISRYELPNFKVNVDPDRKFYLPGQDATVTVRADYLFGQPVLRGHVRVVQESERSWNYREQKWELDEDNEQTGETNADGSFVVKFDLKSHHEDLSDSDYERFRDITFAAYFTDPTTNRTEQRRFDIRVTKDPIHVYLVETYDWSYNRELPLKFYVSTFYADGSPARCKVNVNLTDDADDPDITKRVATVTTNRYGLAKISAQVPKDFDTDELEIVLSASDSSGRKGSATEELRLDEDPRVRVETNKTIYRPGEAVTAFITATSAVDETMVVDLAGLGGLISSQRVRLHRGRAWVRIPFKPEFKNTVSIVAYPESATSRSMIGLRTVLYPQNSELNVDVRSSQDTYRPGEDAKLDLSVRSAGDRAEESALGVVVLDQAVIERFRTDREFGGRSYDSESAIQEFLGLEDQVAGIRLRDLQRLDTSRAVSSDLDLLAAVLLRDNVNYFPAFYSSDEFEEEASTTFGPSINEQLKPVKNALADQYTATMKYPARESELQDTLSHLGIDFNTFRDPWGMPYRAESYVHQQNENLSLLSSGPDKRYDTPDDFLVDRISWPYFRSLGEKINRAIMRYHHRTGKFIRDAVTLREEIATDGFNLDRIHDRWGKPYRFDFEIRQTDFVLNIRSSGPDGQFSKNAWDYRDDFIVWAYSIDYFAEPRAQISAALTEHLNRTKTFPQSDQEWSEALRALGKSFENLRDPWGRPYYQTFKTQLVQTQRVQVEKRANFGDKLQAQTNVLPVTQTVAYIFLRSSGPDGKVRTGDDFTVATFSGVVEEKPPGPFRPIVFTAGVAVPVSSGAIVGTVTDPSGAVVSQVTVKATSATKQVFETSTNENGRYGFASLTAGTYELSFDAPGFSSSVIAAVVVRSNNITEVNATLSIGTVAETVTVTGGPSSMTTQATSASVSSGKNKLTDPSKVVNTRGSQQLSTPRLREYFPETLLWQPSIETDKRGRAQVNFKLADNITTWKVVVIGSTEDGRIGTVEKDIKAFQPFFIEHDPPRVLTEGDEIFLPVVVRNYLSQAQRVDLEIKPESWFSLVGPAQKQTSVVAGDALRETFDFRVTASVKDGKQRITARGSDEQDAIEKPVSVHPDGQELSVTAGDILDDGSSLELDIAPNRVPDSNRGELKIYPNLLAHVTESVEAIMERPYGCGEQTISSTYPSLLLLRHYKKSGENFPLSGRAQRYLKDGYSRLLNYRSENGGFAYWVNGANDVALTAYASRFLVDATELIAVDETVVKTAREWLVSQQQADGSWRHPGWTDRQPQDRTVLLTAYVTRVLARVEAADSQPLKRGLDFLGRESQRIAEPYLISSYALAAIDAKDVGRASTAIEKLRTLAREDGNTTYWTLEGNTPFHGWGLAGRVETTALVVQALVKHCNSQNAAGCEADKKLINRGLLYLLKQKDRYGVWHSTQATVNVLDAMSLLFSPNSATGQSSAELVVNGNPVQTLQTNDRAGNPLTVDISSFLRVGKNRIEITRPRGLPVASVQAVANYYVPWSSDSQPANDSAKSEVRLQVKFDKTDAKINEEITCRVEAARRGARSWGMMLAEIGIPPGAEVDRSSLQALLKDWTISQYDVLPDRVVVYLWPTAAGVSFNFKFRPRFGMKAKTAPSTLYDYYNPEATVVVPPSVFTVR